MRVQVVDPSAYTPPYDHALCRALGAAGAEVELYTSRFAYGPVPAPEGYARVEHFYRAGALLPGSGPAAQRARRALKLAEHVPDMLRYRRAARGAEVVHFQWLSVQQLDGRLLPRGRPLVLTAHDVLPREPKPGQREAQRRLYERFDAVVAHSAHGRTRLIEELGVAAERVHVIPHGAFAHLAEAPQAPPPFQTDKPVVLFFGLLRPYKGIDVLLEAWRGVEDAELWIAGMPRMDISALRASAPASVRFVPRFITDEQLPPYFRRADLVVLPYREIEQSGVLFTALAFGKPLLLSDVGGFGEIAAAGAARAVPPGDPAALREGLLELLGDPAKLEALAARSRRLGEGEYGWEGIARRTLALYAGLLER
ncbi:MAG TPA: glycosyltransferase family 4 protein [Solirubrobacteraceae bacterium]|jgi:glycosyltransferase involved in cell wall biosynthesis|nr:glycosyltransferase family 4 protein [Solirubrobacteraceae bacterium]